MHIVKSNSFYQFGDCFYRELNVKLAKQYQKQIKLKEPRIAIDVNLFLYRPSVVKRGDKSLRTKTGWFQACPERRRYHHTEGEWTTRRSWGFFMYIPFARLSRLLRCIIPELSCSQILKTINIHMSDCKHSSRSSVVPVGNKCQSNYYILCINNFWYFKIFFILFSICSLTRSHMYHVLCSVNGKLYTCWKLLCYSDRTC